MISKKETKEIAGKNSKKLGQEAFQKLDSITKEFILKLIKQASRKADYQGRTILKKEDFES